MKIFIIGLLAMGAGLSSLKGQEQQNPADNGTAFSQFASIGKMYQQLPVQLTIQIQNRAVPVTTATDTMQTHMELYIGPHFYYLQTEGIEEMINDSLLLMVNNKIKEMQLFRSSPGLLDRAGKMPVLFMQDSSRQALEDKFDARVVIMSRGNKRIDLISKARVQGTDVPRESISVEYNPTTFQIMECVQHKTRLIPIEVEVYKSLQADADLSKRLLQQTGTAGEMYFLVKENSTRYKFTRVDKNVLKPPVNTGDRIVKSDLEKYMPAKGFEEYNINQQF